MNAGQLFLLSAISYQGFQQAYFLIKKKKNNKWILIEHD